MSNDPTYKRLWYRRNRARILAERASRYATDASHRAYVKAKAARWILAHPNRAAEHSRACRVNRREKIRTYSRDYRLAFPLKVAAHTAVGHAIRDGKLQRQACERCAATRNVVGHHDNYLKPLDVRWLCKSCHWHEHH